MDRIIKEKVFHNDRFSDETRSALDKYYSIAETTSAFYNNSIFTDCKGKVILEYGCGLGSAALDLASAGANVTAIDISEVAIEKAKEVAEKRGLSENIRFTVMNAEHLEYENEFFDLVCGAAILHHLDLQKALSELSRVLKKDGKAVFLEPLGHNILINLYRRLTPRMRTEDEHPLRRKDFESMKHFFPGMTTRFFHLTTFITLPLRKTALFRPVLKIFTAIDALLFSFSIFQYQAWHVVIGLCKSR